MKIAVLVKQTPQLSEVAWGGDSLKWSDDVLAVNPFDEYAVEEALRIKEKTGGTTVAITYGPAAAVQALRDVLALGIDEAVHIEADNYSAIDPQNAAMILAAAIRKIPDINLVLTGKQACDDDSTMVASSVAAYLDWPQIGFVKQIDQIDDSKIVARRTTDLGYDLIEAHLPAVCSVVKEINEPRLPSLKGKMRAKKVEITKFSLPDLGLTSDSLIQVKGLNPPRARPQGEILQGEPEQVIGMLIDKLKADQLL